MVAQDDGLRREDRFPDNLCNLFHLEAESLHHIAFNQERDLCRFRADVQRFLDPFPDAGSIIFRKDREHIGFDLELVVPHHDFADDLDDIPQFGLGIGPDPGFDKRGRVLGPGLIDYRKDGRPAGLLDLGDLALDGNGLPDFCGQFGDPDRRGFPLNVLDLVDLVYEAAGLGGLP